VISFTGFDFLGGGMRNNAATIFVTQIPWDERKVTAQQLVGELFGKTGAHQGSAGARVQPAADLRPRHRRAATSSTSRTAAKAAPSG
jgi:multidrug efflux pump subunit AcrB